MNTRAYNYVKEYENGRGADSVTIYYNRCSRAKISSEIIIRNRMEKAGGSGYRVLYGNTFRYTAAWCVDKYLIIETCYNIYMIDKENYIFLDGETAAAIMAEFENKKFYKDIKHRIENTQDWCLSNYYKEIALDYIKNRKADRIPVVFAEIVKRIVKLEFLHIFEDAENLLEEKLHRLIESEYFFLDDELIEKAIDAVESEIEDEKAAYNIENELEYIYHY